MCTGAESRGDINGDPVISKVGGDYEDRMRTIELEGGGEERACNCGTFVQGLLQGIHHHLTALNLPTLSASEVGIIPLTVLLFFKPFLSCCFSNFFLL